MKLIIAALALVVLLGCTVQLALKMKCSGDCELEIERGIDIPAPSSSQAPVPNK